MRGRGYFRSQLAQLNAAKNQEEQNDVQTPVPVITNAHTPFANRGRQAMLDRYKQILKSKESNLTASLSSLELRDSNDAKSQTLFFPSANNEIPKLPVSTTQPQSQSETVPQQQPVFIETNETSIEEKAPVICRVSNKSDNYHINEFSSNYIKVELDENKSIYQYTVTFDPLVDVKSAKFYLINQHQNKFPTKVFNGTLLYTATMLKEDVTVLMGKLKDESEVKITIIFKCKNTLFECLSFYNIFLRGALRTLGLIEFGKNFYDEKKKIAIPQYKLEIWPGFITTFSEFENGLYICCDISYRVLCIETILQKIDDIATRSKNNNLNIKEEIMAAICGCTVITRYNNKTYIIDDIDYSITPLSTFKQQDSEISYVNYYKKMYGIDIKDLKQPMIIVKSKKNVMSANSSQDSNSCCLVPELCNLTGLSEKMKCDFKLMQALQKHTTVTPEKRQNTLIDFINSVNDHRETCMRLKNWGITLQPIPVKVQGPVYKREAILLGNNLRKQVNQNMNWALDITKNAMFKPVNVLNWAILYNFKDETLTRSFCKQLAKCGKAMGMNINSPLCITVNGMNPEYFISAINNTVKSNSELQLIVIIFPNIREDRYNAVKRICCSEIGIPSQVIISRTLSIPQRLQLITQKIALQINCKLGGACWSIDIPLKNTIIVGIDTFHEKLKRTASVIGFVASMDKTFTKWYSVAEFQNCTNQELSSSIIEFAFHKILNKYKEKNGMLPEKIIIYRDGVSDGDLNVVKEGEIKNLEESFNKCFSANYCPMVTFIIVKKRINTKFFQFLNEKYSNPDAGTVIDNTITRRNYFDFYLVSQNVRQGTVCPTHYIVLQNGCKLSIENVQRLSYKLCHMYYNWCGTIKVPAPIQYAHKLAYLIGQNVRQAPSNKLTESLFFL